MPSLPSTLSFTINAANDLVCSKVNQDNFGTTYRGSLATSTEDIVAIVKITHREEGTKTSPKERHVLDVVLTYYPNDGSPSYTAQTYVHFIRRRGSSKIHSERTATGIAQVLNPATTLGIGVMDWGVL